MNRAQGDFLVTLEELCRFYEIKGGEDTPEGNQGGAQGEEAQNIPDTYH